MNKPTVNGFYWAQWIYPDTHYMEFEVVYVEIMEIYIAIYVAGREETFWLSDFENLWGPLEIPTLDK